MQTSSDWHPAADHILQPLKHTQYGAKDIPHRTTSFWILVVCYNHHDVTRGPCCLYQTISDIHQVGHGVALFGGWRDIGSAGTDKLVSLQKIL